MRALVTRSVRPRIGSTSSTNLLSTASPVRQAIFPPTRRKLTLSDAFTILLAPVFAAAFVADATLKDGRRRDWDKKIAEVRAEIEAIRERELQSWNLVQMKSIHVGVRHQRREYTTAARAMTPEEMTTQDSEDTHSQSGELQLVQNSDSTAIRDEMALLKSRGTDQVRQRHENEHDPRILANWQQYESLLASKLAIELILHIRTGKSWLYRQPTEIMVQPDLFPESLDDLMVQLHRVNDALKQLNSRKRPGEVPYRLLSIPARNTLHEDIAGMARDCKEGKITIVQLVYGYASAIGGSKTAPKSASYRALMDAFLTLDNESLAYTAMSALQNCQQRLNNADIGNMIFQYGHFRDSGRFSKFLRLLAKRESSCILRLTVPWEHVTVNGIRVPVPMDRNARLIATCVQAALECSMVQHAEAWTAILFQSGNRDELGYVMKHIVTYYTQHCDWTYGSRWVQEIIKRATLIADENSGQLSMCVMRMLELCVACDQQEMYERLMNAVIVAGIEPESINQSRPEFFSDRIISIRWEWIARRKKSKTAKEQSTKPTSHVEQAILFQEALAKDDSTLLAYIGSRDGLDIITKSDSADAAETSETRFRPFHTPTELLGGDPAPWQRAEEPESTQNQIHDNDLQHDTNRENLYQTRISELEMQLAESQKSNAELLHKLNNQSIITPSQELAQENQPSRETESGLSHLHLLTDHEKLLQDYTDLQTRHQTLLSNHRALRQKVNPLPKNPHRTMMTDRATVSVLGQTRVQSKRQVEYQPA